MNSIISQAPHISQVSPAQQSLSKRALQSKRLQQFETFLAPLAMTSLPMTNLDLDRGGAIWSRIDIALLGRDKCHITAFADPEAEKGTLSRRDPLEALADAPSESVGVVSALQLTELFTLDAIRMMISETLRVLAPGGLMIMDVIKLDVIRSTEPDLHAAKKPDLHAAKIDVPSVLPDVLCFMLEYAGFSRVRTVMIKPPTIPGRDMSDSFQNVRTNYMLIAQKDGPSDIMAQTSGLFPRKALVSNRIGLDGQGVVSPALQSEMMARIQALELQLASSRNCSARDIQRLTDEVAWMRKAKKTTLYYRSKTVRKLHAQINQWLKNTRDQYDTLIKRVNILPLKDHKGIIVRKIPSKRGPLPQAIRWRLEGPFDSSYSLALVNRELARALERQGVQVTLKSDHPVQPDFLARNPDLKAMAERSDKSANTASINNYPPEVSGLKANLAGLHCYAWEETALPRSYVDAFNQHLHYITVTSAHVRKVMIDNGVSVPCYSVGNGVDHFEAVHAKTIERLPTAATRFLHVSSCFPRKGPDVLLNAWAMAFNGRKDVALIIKTFTNPHNDISDRIAEMRELNPEMAPIVLLEEDLDDGEMRGLYEACDVAVFPSRAEGFGLPVAEAVLCAKRVITTGWSGQMEFAELPLVSLIDYEFQEARSHLGTDLSMWAEPDVRHLAALMQKASSEPQPTADDIATSRRILLERFSWDAVARRSITALRETATRDQSAPPRLGWISTYNTRCGIATYSEHLIRHLGIPVHVLAEQTDSTVHEDATLGLEISRCWTPGKQDIFGILAAIRKAKLQSIIIQFNYGFFSLSKLAELITALKAEGRQVCLTLHSTSHPDPSVHLASISDVLALCDRIIVHQVKDANYLKQIGLVGNVMLFPHGMLPIAEIRPPLRKDVSVPFVVGSYGFFLPHKGLVELVEAVTRLRDMGHNVRLRMINAEYPTDESRALIADIKQMLTEHALEDIIELETRFLSDEEALEKLAECDLIVYPYQKTSESASGALRYGLLSGRPVARTPLQIFSDVADYTLELPGISPSDIARGLLEALHRMRGEGEKLDSDMTEMLQRAREHCEARSYATLGPRFRNTLIALWEQRSLSYSPEIGQ